VYRWAAIDDGTDGSAMTLAEGGDTEESTESGHVLEEEDVD
jgi:hypothetical protein